MTLLEMFETHKGIPSHKFPHHLEIYENFFTPFKEKEITLLEIGIEKGGSLELWRKYFGQDARIIGVDIQDRMYLSKKVDAVIFMGDQKNPDFWQSVKHELKPLHIVIDDGSHQCSDQIETFKILFPLLEDGGLYCIEDIHTSYREEYGGGLDHPGSFISYIHELINDLHYSEFADHRHPSHIYAVHVYPSLAIIEKRNPSTWGGSTMRPVNPEVWP